MAKNEEVKSVQIRVDLHNKLKKLALEKNITLKKLLEELIINHLKK